MGKIIEENCFKCYRLKKKFLQGRKFVLENSQKKKIISTFYEY